ncbi:hypothetical protein [Bacillus sp. E(2018)]|nr:hypothetical protein [Bacillus sp. E(2018)]
MKSVKKTLNIQKLMEDYQVAGLSIAEIEDKGQGGISTLLVLFI